MNLEFNAQSHAQYQALTSTCGVVDLAGRAQIELTGSDRTTFLNNLCTNDIRKLVAGQGCEAYITTIQGKVLAHVFVFCTPSSLVLESACEMATPLSAHLDRYIITEDVQLHDRTEQWHEVLLSGPQADQCLHSATGCDPPRDSCEHLAIDVEGAPVWVRRVPMTCFHSFLVGSPANSMPPLLNAMQAHGAVSCDESVFHSVRIECGFPWFPLDINSDNLPQEAGRDAQTISFTKGCYLGQETVARLDALGHVNRILTGLKLSGEGTPESGSELTHDGKAIGRLTSFAYSPMLNAPIAMGMVRCALTKPTTRLDLGSMTAQVIELPIESRRSAD